MTNWKQISEELAKALSKVAASQDNEGTDTPYWMIIDPRQNMRCDLASAAAQFEGPFFSRESAEAHLNARRYEFGSRANVWCASAYWSREYKELYKASRQARAARLAMEVSDDIISQAEHFIRNCEGLPSEDGDMEGEDGR